MKKKLLSVLLCICVTAGLLAGCGSSASGDAGTASEGAAGDAASAGGLLYAGVVRMPW